MTQYQTGADALAALNASTDGGSSNSFTKLKSGASFNVRVMSAADLSVYYGYGIYKEVDTFVAESPCTLNEKGFPKSNLTVWDKASDYYSKLAQAETNNDKQKELKAQASRYRGSRRFILGFIDLDTGTPIVIDFSHKQALGIHAVIKKNEAKLGKKAFELEKTGSGKDTVVTLSVLDLDDLDDKQQANFAKWDGKEFDKSLFEGLLFVADEAKQIENLTTAKFDVSLIGYDDAPSTQSETSDETSGEEESEELPF